MPSSPLIQEPPPSQSKRLPSTFDEQLWPVNVALLILAGFVAGAIIAKSAFVDEPRLLYNGWMRLGSLAVTAGVLMWVASRITSHRFQRALQLAALVSIILHVLLIAGLYRQSDRPMRNLFEPDARVAENAPPEPPPVVLPEYHLEGPSEQPQENTLSKPVEALARDDRHSVPQKQPPRKQQPPEPAPLKPLQEPAAPPKVDIKPNSVKMAERQEAAPRRGEPSKLSKRPAEARINPENPVPATPDTKITEQQPAKIAPKVSHSRRETKSPAADAAKVSDQELSQPLRQQTATKLARREKRESREELPSTPTAPKALNKPAALPRSNETAADLGVSAAAKPSAKPAPQAKAARRRAISDDELLGGSPPDEVKLPGPRPAPVASNRAEKRDEPQLASAAGASPKRLAKERLVPKGAAELPKGIADDPTLAGSAGRGAAAGDKSTGSPSLAQSTSIERRANSGNLAAGPLAAVRPSDSPAVPRAVAGTQQQRAETGLVASLDPSVRATNTPNRAARSAKLEASPVPIDNPVAGQPNPSAMQPTAQPGRAALVRGNGGGLAGLGEGPNLDQGVPAADKPASVAGMSAQRSRATQAEGSGTALTPSAPAVAPRSTAGARAPQATLAASDAPLPTEPGAAPGRVGPANVGAGAALQRADSGAVRGPVTAGAGPGQIDTGPTHVVPVPGRAGSALGAGGGGEPDTTLAAATGPTIRGSSRGAGPASLATAQVADVPEAPAGDGGGTPGGSPTATGSLPAATRGGGQGASTLAQMAIEGGLGTGGAGTGAGGSGNGGAGPTGGNGGGTGAGSGVGNGPAGPGSGTSGAGSANGSGVTRLGMSRATGNGEDSAGPSVGAGGIGLGTAGRGAGSVGSRQPHGLGSGSVAGNLADVPDGLAGAAGAPGGAGGGNGDGSGTGDGTGPGGRGGSANSRGDGTGTGDGPGDGGELAAATGVQRRAGGFPGLSDGGPVGTAAGDVVVDTPLVSGVGNGMNPRAGGGGDAAAETSGVPTSGVVRGANVAGGRLGGGVSSAAEMIDDVPSPSDSGPVGGAGIGPGELALSSAPGAPGRRAGGLAVDVDGPAGPGGLGGEFSPQVGSPQRHAQRDSEVINAGTGRFLGRKSGGPLVADTRVREPSKAFAGRGSLRSALDNQAKPLERTEEAVELGLDFLARQQLADGRWSLALGDRRGAENEAPTFRADTAATGLALLSFLGAGYDHYDDQYQRVVQAGLQFLVDHQRADGNLYLSQDPVTDKSAQFYSHGIATIALCEAYGMTGDESLRKAAQRAVDFIVASQHRKLGGWRYEPQFTADTSVSGWQLMALKSGELAGLKVPHTTYELASHWLDQAQVGPADASHYVYNPFASESQKQGRKPTTTMTAVGLLMRLYLGWNRDDPRMQQGAQHLLQNLPSLGSSSNPARDTYYWYYATQVMFHMKGDYWRQWNERLHPLLVDQQVRSGPLAGSWDPLGPIPDRWGPRAGRIYVTTMNLLSLEVYYRHLPIYESEAK